MSAFNPATIDQHVIQFDTDAGSEYEVSLFSETTGKFEPVAADQLCFNATRDTPWAYTYTACELYVGATVPA